MKDEDKHREYKNRDLRKVFGIKRDEFSEEWIRLHSSQMHALYA